MTTEERLRAALESRAATARRSPDALPEIRRRAGRRRWAARGQVALATAAVAGVVVAAGALATSGGSEPDPPVTTTTPAPSPTTSTTPEPTASPSEARAAAVAPEEYVALLQDGRLVVASAADGRIGRTIANVPGPRAARYDLDLTPDRAAVYLTEPGPDTCERDGSIARYDVATGERTEVARGHALSVSPDGTRLAYVPEGCAGGAVEVLDLKTGQTTRYPNTQRTPDDPDYDGPWNATEVVWHADGRQLWVVMEWELITDLRLLDPATDRDLKDAASMRSEYSAFGLERRGDGLVYLHICCYPEPEDAAIVVRDAAGAERKVVTSQTSGELTAALAGPDGDLLYTRSGRVYRLDLDSGATTDLGASTAVARDW